MQKPLSLHSNTTHEITQQISCKLLRMDVLTSETCWALNNEIIKQVTSSWSLFIQLLYIHVCICVKITIRVPTTWIYVGGEFKYTLENCALLGYYTRSSGNFLSAFQDYILVPSSRIQKERTGRICMKFGYFSKIYRENSGFIQI